MLTPRVIKHQRGVIKHRQSTLNCFLLTGLAALYYIIPSCFGSMRHRSLVQGFQRLLHTSKQACSCTQAIAGFVPGHLGAGDTPSTSYTVISQYMCEQQRRWHSAPSSQQGQEGPETIDFGKELLIMLLVVISQLFALSSRWFGSAVHGDHKSSVL